MRKTKIICTMGPATDDVEVLEQLVREGMDVARFNFSHGTHEEQEERMSRLRAAREKYGKPVAILLDTKGPEIRIRDFKDGKITVTSGQKFTLTGRKLLGDDTIASITYPTLSRDITPGTRILIDDGLIELHVDSVDGEDIHCTINNDGVISNHKGVNVPGIHANMPYMSDQDKADILFGIGQNVDYVAASFVRSAADVMQIRSFLYENGGSDIKIIAKIENGEGVENIDEIIEESDAIMIARGDMGVELPEEEVPIVQKLIIKKVYEAGKQVITATQMLDSMMKNPRPTRAETADVANAIYDGTSAIMLSGETAAGRFPVESLKTMVRIAERTEDDIDYKKRFFEHDRDANPDITDAISHATCTTAHDLNASAIVTVTRSGRSARMISRYRPYCVIIGCAMTEKVWRQLNMSWGVVPILLEEKQDTFELFDHAIDICRQQNLVEKDDVVVITSGVPLGKSGTTNMIKVHVV
jgi:pyruvate kinase